MCWRIKFGYPTVRMSSRTLSQDILIGHFQPETLDFILQFVDDIRVLTDVVHNVHHIPSYLRLDLFGAVRVDKRIPRLLEMYASWTNVCQHHRLTVSSQRILEQPRQLTVSIVHISRSRLVSTCKRAS